VNQKGFRKEVMLVWGLKDELEEDMTRVTLPAKPG
jgi:hypothetical protein